MRDPIVERIAWRRRGVRGPVLGILSAGEGGIRLKGRDPVSGIEVTLSIPLDEVESVHMADAADDSPGTERGVILELVGSEAILLTRAGAGPSRIALLARRLAALTHAEKVPVVQGG